MNDKLDVLSVFVTFWEFCKSHGVRTAVAVVTGYFTYFAGYSLTNDPVFGLTLVALSEGMSLWYPFILEGAQSVGTLKALNWKGLMQWISASVGTIGAWVAIAATDIASATIIANKADMSIFTAFSVVPEWSQAVVAYVLPVNAFFHMILLALFYIASPEAEQARAIRTINREADRRIKTANAKARKEQAEAEASEYERIANEKAVLAGQAKARKRANSDFQVYALEDDTVNPTQAAPKK